MFYGFPRCATLLCQARSTSFFVSFLTKREGKAARHIKQQRSSFSLLLFFLFFAFPFVSETRFNEIAHSPCDFVYFIVETSSELSWVELSQRRTYTQTHDAIMCLAVALSQVLFRDLIFFLVFVGLKIYLRDSLYLNNMTIEDEEQGGFDWNMKM